MEMSRYHPHLSLDRGQPLIAIWIKAAASGLKFAQQTADTSALKNA
jgi:hypothetical protein